MVIGLAKAPDVQNLAQVLKKLFVPHVKWIQTLAHEPVVLFAGFVACRLALVFVVLGCLSFNKPNEPLDDDASRMLPITTKTNQPTQNEKTNQCRIPYLC